MKKLILFILILSFFDFHENSNFVPVNFSISDELKDYWSNYRFYTENFNYFKLELQWPLAIVNAYEDLKPNLYRDHLKKYKRSNIFTIHNFLRVVIVGTSGACSYRPEFDPNKLNTIKGDLKIYWPSFKDNNPYRFWKNQYNRHFCHLMVTDPHVNQQFYYFNFVLQRAKEFNENFGDLLRRVDIRGINLDRSTFANYIDKVNDNKAAKIKCCSNGGYTEYVCTISICFDINMVKEDCPNRGYDYCNEEIKLRWI